jgi:hypothetical protein
MVIWEACRTGAGSTRGVGFLVGFWMLLSCTRLVPVLAGWDSSHSTQSWSPARPDGWGESKGQRSAHLTHNWGLAGREGQWAPGRGVGIPVSCGPALGWGLAHTVDRIPVIVDPVAWPRGRYPGMVWVQGLGASMAEGQVSQWCVDLVQPERQGSHCVWGMRGAVAWCSLRGGEPGRMEQHFADLPGGDLAGQLSQVCLQLLGRVSASGAHEVCCSVSIAILDP